MWGAPIRNNARSSTGAFFTQPRSSRRGSAGTVLACRSAARTMGGQRLEWETVESEIDVAGGDYLQALGIRLLDGNWFRDEDWNESSGAAIVNDFIAKRLWPGQSAIGQQV